jgi:hypothetical protein
LLQQDVDGTSRHAVREKRTAADAWPVHGPGMIDTSLDLLDENYWISQLFMSSLSAAIDRRTSLPAFQNRRLEHHEKDNRGDDDRLRSRFLLQDGTVAVRGCIASLLVLDWPSPIAVCRQNI